MIPFSPPHIDQKILDEVVATLKSGWISTGPKAKQFEDMLQHFTGAKAVLCLNSATAGLELALRWYGIKEGDEVIVPAYTYCATANVILHCGATPVFLDVQDDLNIDVSAIKNAITDRTKAIIPVDIAGFPCDYDMINDLVKDPQIISSFKPNTAEQNQLGRILVLADAAHSLGAIYKGKQSGSLADMTAFSFHAVKNLSTAEGGALCLNLPNGFNNENIYKNLRTLSLHGQSKDAMAKFNAIGQWEYDVQCAGYKMNMPDVLAAIGVVELERYDTILNRRKSIFDQYTKGFEIKSWAITPRYETKEKTSSYHVYALRIKNVTEQQRNQIIDEVFARQVAVNVHFKPLPMMTIYKALGYKIEDYPNAYKQYACEISLPVHFDLSDEQIKTVIKVVTAAVEKVIG